MATRTGTQLFAKATIADDSIPAQVADQSEINGGWHSVADITARDATALQYRRWGMVVNVENDTNTANNKQWVLTRPSSSVSDNDTAALMENGNWVPFSSGEAKLPDFVVSAEIKQPYKWIDGKDVYKAVGRFVNNNASASFWNWGGSSGITTNALITAPLIVDTIISFNGSFISHNDAVGLPGVKFKTSINGKYLSIDLCYSGSKDSAGNPLLGFSYDGTNLPNPSILHYLYLIIEYTKP